MRVRTRDSRVIHVETAKSYHVVEPALAVRILYSEETVLHGSAGERTEPTAYLCLSGADGLWASKLKHAVEGMNCDGDLGRATLVRP
jgi:hypothetical protein